MSSQTGQAATASNRPVTCGAGVYVLDHSRDVAAPRRLVVPGRRLFRFMDAIYLDRPSEKLDVKKVQALNAARRPLLARSDVSLTNTLVRSALAAGVRAAGTKQVLEWGCGFHPMRSQLVGMRYIGLDIDPLVIRHNRPMRYIPWNPAFVLADAELARLDHQQFDAVVSAFVFHFRLSRLHIATMRRVLRPGGFILANVYRRSSRSRRELRAAFAQVGFDVQVSRDPVPICDGQEFWAMSLDENGFERASRAIDAVLTAVKVGQSPNMTTK